MDITAYFTVTLQRSQHIAFRALAERVHAHMTLRPSDGLIMFIVTGVPEKVNAFERSLAGLVGSPNYQRYNHPLPGFDMSDGYVPPVGANSWYLFYR